MTHDCYFRGCDEAVGMDKRYCERHEAVARKRKAIIAERARARAAERGAWLEKERSRYAIYHQTTDVPFSRPGVAWVRPGPHLPL